MRMYLPSKYDVDTLATAGNKILGAVQALRRLEKSLPSMPEHIRLIMIRQKLDNAESAGSFVEKALGALRKCRAELPPEGELPERLPPGSP